MDNLDVVIIGAGLAGMWTALKLGDLDVALVAPGRPGASGASPRAKGGIAAALGEADRPTLHARDTMEAGDGLCHPGIVDLVTGRGPQEIVSLAERGVPFDRDDGALELGREAAHDRRRIVKAGGDSTGYHVCRTLGRQLREAPGCQVLTGMRVVELVSDGRRVGGVVVADADGQTRLIPAPRVVLATGGLGQLFRYTSNPPDARGDGLVVAHRAGAALADLEFVQFHPTALAVEADPLPLLSEAIRGEGAVLVDSAGRRFMTDVHPDAELAPRDVVARAIRARYDAGESVFLDVRGIEDFAARFPGAAADCKAFGVDPTHRPLPVRPVAHYHMGGVAVDRRGRTSLEGLWACGEVAATGVHGANRLASNSLLEALVFADQVSRDIRGYESSGASPGATTDRETSRSGDGADSEWPEVFQRLRQVMWEHVGIVRTARGLERAEETVDELLEAATDDSMAAGRLRLARLVIRAARRRDESRGGHYRADCPESRSEWRRRLLVRDGELFDEAVDVERDYWV